MNDLSQIALWSYFDERVCKIIVYRLMATSLSILLDTAILQKIDTLEDMFTEGVKEWLRDQVRNQRQPLDVYLANFNKEMNRGGKPIINAIKLVVCFENLLKAELLYNGYIIHLISKKKPYNKIFNKQRQIPIQISDIISPKPLTEDEDLTFKYKSLTEQTISFSTLLNEGYQTKLDFPPEMYNILATINKKRNTLHLLIEDDYVLGKKRFDEYRRLKEIAYKYILRRYAPLAVEQEKLINDVLNDFKQHIGKVR